jgi:Flp pilus assembly protein TadB
MSTILTAAAAIIGTLVTAIVLLWRRSRAETAQAAEDRAEAAHIRTLHQQQVERQRKQRQRDEVERLKAAERRAAEVREVYRAGEVAKRIESPDAEVSDAAAKEASADALRALAGWDNARR